MTRILITGAGSGLGEGAATGIARNGYDATVSVGTTTFDGRGKKDGSLPVDNDVVLLAS